MNLHVGSGTHPSLLPGWVDIDLAAPATLVGTVFRLPFPERTFTKVYLGHVLEHLRWEDQLEAALLEIRRVSRLGATVMTVGPDIAKAIDTGQPATLLHSIIGGAPATSPGGHQWIATEALTIRALQRGGLAEITPVDVTTVSRPDWPNPSQASWQCAVTATVR